MNFFKRGIKVIEGWNFGNLVVDDFDGIVEFVDGFVSFNLGIEFFYVWVID